MGQYHTLYNLDKKEYVHAHRIDCGLKLLEQVGFQGSTADALFLLIAVSNGRGGGDAPRHDMIGRWGGDRVAVIGDYKEPSDIEGFNFDELEDYTDISTSVKAMLDVVSRAYQ